MDLKEKTSKELAEERRIQKLEERLEKLAELRGIEDEFEVKGYVYKIRANNSRDTCRPAYAVLDDHEFGLQYGPGKYEVVYIVNGTRENSRHIHYSIHPSYKSLHKEWCLENGEDFYDESQQVAQIAQGAPRIDFSKLMTPEGAAAIFAGVEALKRVFGGGQNELMRDMMNQQARVIESALGGSKKESALENKIMSAAVERLLAPQKSNFEEMRGQIDMLKELGVSTGLLQDPHEEKGPGSAIIEKALEHLPALLERFANNPVHAGRALIREQPGARLLLATKKNQAAAIEAVQRKHGSEIAQGLAQGVGIKQQVIESALKREPRAPVDPPIQAKKIETTNGVLSL